jgi:hypothetical protein
LSAADEKETFLQIRSEKENSDVSGKQFCHLKSNFVAPNEMLASAATAVIKMPRTKACLSRLGAQNVFEKFCLKTLHSSALRYLYQVLPRANLCAKAVVPLLKCDQGDQMSL